VGVAGPDDAPAYRLAPVDVPGELERAEEALEGVDVRVLNTLGPVSLNAIIRELDAEPDGFDVLYLVCHGALVEGDPRLWLEKDEAPGAAGEGSRSAIVSGTTLAERLAGLANRPRLVVLMSCESAGTEGGGSRKDDGALAAVGPRLARAGIPAVIAMQGRVSMRTVAEFLPPFFRSIHATGQIDLAVATARALIRARRTRGCRSCSCGPTPGGCGPDRASSPRTRRPASPRGTPC
jgi:hypothetical protein